MPGDDRKRVVVSTRKPRLPDELKVGPFVYTVTDDVLSHVLAENESREELYGRCDLRRLAISLNPDQAPMQKRSTMVHEALHAVIATAAFPIDNDDEERLIRCLEAPLLALIRDNPELVAWLAASD
jgi:hypothetical protein